MEGRSRAEEIVDIQPRRAPTLLLLRVVAAGNTRAHKARKSVRAATSGGRLPEADHALRYRRSRCQQRCRSAAGTARKGDQGGGGAATLSRADRKLRSSAISLHPHVWKELSFCSDLSSPFKRFFQLVHRRAPRKYFSLLSCPTTIPGATPTCSAKSDMADTENESDAMNRCNSVCGPRKLAAH